jgi:hypothetical protein
VRSVGDIIVFPVRKSKDFFTKKPHSSTFVFVLQAKIRVVFVGRFHYRRKYKCAVYNIGRVFDKRSYVGKSADRNLRKSQRKCRSNKD